MVGAISRLRVAALASRPWYGEDLVAAVTVPYGSSHRNPDTYLFVSTPSEAVATIVDVTVTVRRQCST